MNILLTGGSSFTGLWFAEALAAQGLHVIAPLRGRAADYAGLRGERVRRLGKTAEIIEACPFGGDAFLDVMRGGEVDALCHHAAQVKDYKRPDFDALDALEENTRNLPRVLDAGQKLRAVILTGSVFEADAGRGTEPREAFSPYGLSKTLTAQVFRYWCAKIVLPFTRFIIPNPFGPYEEPRFCDYLLKCWKDGQAATVKTPDYVRDNVPVSLLAKAYADGVKRALEGEAVPHIAPSFYAETQIAFAHRMSRELAPRLGLPCAVEAVTQADFAEPLVRINTDETDVFRLEWNEKAAWDELASYYRAAYLKQEN
ncbi:MAG: NAD(P)-dependent oxidoreductase [Negativicutes bacterium]|nr:NAD(P)-dependent oxidoreductase [Negativicutes bacterium]